MASVAPSERFRREFVLRPHRRAPFRLRALPRVAAALAPGPQGGVGGGHRHLAGPNDWRDPPAFYGTAAPGSDYVTCAPITLKFARGQSAATSRSPSAATHNTRMTTRSTSGWSRPPG